MAENLNKIKRIKVSGVPYEVYDDAAQHEKPGNGTITINQGGTQKGQFTVNQSEDTTINLDAGGGTADFDTLTNRPKYKGALMTHATDVEEVFTVTINGATADKTNAEIYAAFAAGKECRVAVAGCIQAEFSTISSTYASVELLSYLNGKIILQLLEINNNVITTNQYETYKDTDIDAKIAAIKVYDGALTMQVNGTTKTTFTANQAGDASFNVTASDLGLSQALKFVGISTTDPSSTSGATVSGISTFAIGNVVLYNSKEYLNITGSNTSTTTPNPNWKELGDESSWAIKGASTSGTAPSGTASVSYTKAAANTGLNGGTGTSATSGAGSAHNHSIGKTTTTIPAMSYNSSTGVLTITSGSITVVTGVDANTGNESAHTHSYTAPANHTHSIGSSTATATGTIAVDSHTHTQN